MGQSLDTITIIGFKSIQELRQFELNKLNVLIGGNGAGKSNFIDLFRMLRAMMHLSLPGLKQSTLELFFISYGGFNDFLHKGPKETQQIDIELKFGLNKYKFTLSPTADESFVIANEKRYYSGGSTSWWDIDPFDGKNPGLLKEKDKPGVSGGRSISSYIYEAIDSWRIYHFHDTSNTSGMRRSEIVEDDEYLRFDAANIAPFLLRLKTEIKEAYEEIVDAVRLVTPFFDDFLLKPRMLGEKKVVNLSWTQKGSDYPMQPYHFSDGTLRFICLATALLQPDPPSTLIIDEPELGLHPYALHILAELIQSASHRTQCIISTQSPTFVDHFDPKDIIVVDRKNGASTFERLNADDFVQWLEEYSLGDLWRMNVISGGPSHE